MSTSNADDEDRELESETIVPFFDIAFKNIFEKVTLEYVDQNMKTLHDFFGYKSDLDSCSHIYNQS